VRTLSTLGGSQRLWDVGNVEAHVRASLDAALDQTNARLLPQPYQRAFAFMWSLCWELSGLERDGETLRWVWEIKGFYAPRGPDDEFKPIKLPQFPRPESAAIALDRLQQRTRLVLTSIEKVRPRGAYDPSKGIGFVTYSRRVMMQRLPDFYRSDPEFGDNRYSGSRLEREISYEQLAERRAQDRGDSDGGFLERQGPGSRLEFVDELNPHAYEESIEEVLMRESTASGIEEVFLRETASG
jgi:hypothetical protein